MRQLEANLSQLRPVGSLLRPAEASWKRVKLEARQAGSELKPAASQLEASQAARATARQPEARLLIYLFLKRLDLLDLSKYV